MTKKKHRRHSSEFKMKVLKEHLLNKIAVADVCEQNDIKPSVFYAWQKELFEQGGLIFDKVVAPKKQTDHQQKKLEALEGKLVRKHEVLSELMEEHIELKKRYGAI